MDPHLLRAVLDDPADDAPRLVLADWLEERNAEGDAERAEFIRAQCELAKVPGCNLVADGLIPCRDVFPDPHDGKGGGPHCRTCKRFVRLRRREQELLSASGREWVDGLLPAPAMPSHWSPHNTTPYLVLSDTASVEIRFHRGFVDSVTCAAADWLRHGPGVVRLQPVPAVRLADREPESWANGRFVWYASYGPGNWPVSPAPYRSYLPAELIGLLLPPGVDWVGYGSPDDAHAALSAACLAWAQAQAVTPAVAWPCAC